MKLLRILFTIGVSLSVASAQGPPAAKFKLLYTFPGGPGAPNNIHEISPGSFYGSTSGNYGSIAGEIFSISSTGSFQNILQFPGPFSVGFIAPVENGQLLGFLEEGGSRPEYFTLNKNGAQLKNRPTAAYGAVGNGYPFVIPAPAGQQYTVMGSTPTQTEIVSVAMDGSITTVHAFSGSEGQIVIGSSLLRGDDGSFYGINYINNGSFEAWVYRLTPQGQFLKLGTLTLNTLGPSPPLVLAPDGTIYGATYQGGVNYAGQIFKIPPGGPLTILTTFPANGMFHPTSLIMAEDGNLYGTTHSAISYFFRVVLPSGTLQELYTDAGAGAACTCPMVQGADGKFYGVSPNGGGTGAGTVFSLDVGLAPPKPKVKLVSPSSGAPGTKVLLWGTDLLGATSVTFNGIASPGVAIPTSQSVFTEVPAGATTGPVTITTPNGSFTTTADFTVQ